jgi:LacI family transcriptional regulator
VVNNYTNVPDETREKVRSVIDKYNYVPHASARTLAGVQNKIIGLFMVDRKSDTAGKKVSMSTYFSPFMNGVIDEANKNGYYVLAYAVNKSSDYSNIKEIFFNQTISGGIFIGQQSDDANIRQIIKSGYKVVFVDKDIELESDLSSKSLIINADNVDGAYKATKYLIQLGHTSIAHVTGYMKQLSTIERIEGYKKALAEAGIPFSHDLVFKGNFMQDGGYFATMKLFQKEKPTAIFYANDSMAVGGIQAAQELGLKVPEDLSIIGFDDIEISAYLNPPLTTIRMNFSEMASISVNSLVSSIESDSGFSAHYIIPVELIERKSCLKLNK